MTNEEILKNVNKPDHYNNNKAGIETIVVTRCLCGSLSNCWKYLSRYLQKGTPKQDIKKACWYLKDFRDNPMCAYSCYDGDVPALLANMQKFIDVEEIPEVKSGMIFIMNLVKLNNNRLYDSSLSGSKILEDLENYSTTLS